MGRIARRCGSEASTRGSRRRRTPRAGNCSGTPARPPRRTTFSIAAARPRPADRTGRTTTRRISWSTPIRTACCTGARSGPTSLTHDQIAHALVAHRVPGAGGLDCVDDCLAPEIGPGEIAETCGLDGTLDFRLEIPTRGKPRARRCNSQRSLRGLAAKRPIRISRLRLGARHRTLPKRRRRDGNVRARATTKFLHFIIRARRSEPRHRPRRLRRQISQAIPGGDAAMKRKADEKPREGRENPAEFRDANLRAARPWRPPEFQLRRWECLRRAVRHGNERCEPSCPTTSRRDKLSAAGLAEADAKTEYRTRGLRRSTYRCAENGSAAAHQGRRRAPRRIAEVRAGKRYSAGHRAAALPGA